MPPSPVMRVSPGRELKAENHKRGRSLESGILYREKEDDLALFNEVQNKESFLLQSDDNIDDIFSTKLRYFSDCKLGISIPAREDSSDLLNADGEKNDYDWLITPPETPLFRSLDDEAPLVHPAPRGRPRSQPISISRSHTMEKCNGSSRGSPSPHRLSPSPQSGNSTLQSRSRPFSVTHSSPPPMRHPSPSRRLSSPPSKPISVRRSSTPTAGRLSTGSAGTSTASRVRGTSPHKTSRGNSASPKIRAWQSNIPGFSSEAPPNLRTSLADRPASYVRGSSPASRNGSRYGGKSMSPTGSRSVASSYSHERDPFGSYSKGSVASSGDDDLDSLQSMPVNSSDQSAPRNIGAYPNNTAMSLTKKPTKILSSSAPKRSFDLVRHMDRKGPQDMFRPLLSSVPSSTFHVGKASSHHRSLTSRNSSITTSSNASSDQAASGAHDAEQNQEEVTSDCVRGHYPDIDDEVFVMEGADGLNEDTENRISKELLGGRHGEIDGPPVVISPLGVAQRINQLDATTAVDATILFLDRKHDYPDADNSPDTVMCSKCGRMFHSAEVVIEGDQQLCLECKSSEKNSTIANPPKTVMVAENNTRNFDQISGHRSLEVLGQSASIPESLQVIYTGQTGRNHLEKISNETQHSYSDSSQNLSEDVFEEGELTLASQEEIKQLTNADTGYHQLQHDGAKSNSRLDISECAGISLLLKRSSSVKGLIVQSRSFTASNTSYDDFSYVRGSVSSMRSSSVDLGSSRQTEIRFHRQSNDHNSDTENYRYEMPAKHKRSASSMSGASRHISDAPSVAPSCNEDSFEVIAAHINAELGDETCLDPRELSLASEFTEAESTCADIENNIVFKTASGLSGLLMNGHAGDTSVLSVLTSQEPASHENSDDLTNNSSSLMNAKISSAQSRTSQDDDATLSSSAGRMDVAEVPNLSSLDAISEIEIEHDDVVFSDSHSDVDSTNSKGCTNELQHSDAITVTAEEFDLLRRTQGVVEESMILLEDMGQTKAKSLTLDEATDAILFCGSIVHNLAYEAANIAIDKEALPEEVLRPAATLLGKSNFERRDTRLRKRSSKSQKARQKSLETETKPPPCDAEVNEKSSPCIVRPPDNRPPDNGDSLKPPKLESKCNCIIM